ncbi:WhiB family transcriptional regulator [Nonomuraea sp. NPDC003214]
MIANPDLTRGACRDADPELFFPISYNGADHLRVMAAKAICGSCPIRQRCLDYALTHPAQTADGIWAGTTPDQRRAHRRRTLRARLVNA